MEANYNTAGALDKTVIEAASTKKSLDLKKLLCTFFRSFPHNRADDAVPRNRKSKKRERGRGKPKCSTSWSRGVTFFPFSLLRSQFFSFFPAWDGNKGELSEKYLIRLQSGVGVGFCCEME